MAREDDDVMTNITLRISEATRKRVRAYAERRTAATGTEWSESMALRRLLTSALDDAERAR